MQTDTRTLIIDLNEEITRVKQMINTKGYNNYSAFNHIVREYRDSLKKLSHIINNDLIKDGIKDYNYKKVN